MAEVLLDLHIFKMRLFRFPTFFRLGTVHFRPNLRAYISVQVGRGPRFWDQPKLVLAARSVGGGWRMRSNIDAGSTRSGGGEDDKVDNLRREKSWTIFHDH